MFLQLLQYFLGFSKEKKKKEKWLKAAKISGILIFFILQKQKLKGQQTSIEQPL